MPQKDTLQLKCSSKELKGVTCGLLLPWLLCPSTYILLSMSFASPIYWFIAATIIVAFGKMLLSLFL